VSCRLQPADLNLTDMGSAHADCCRLPYAVSQAGFVMGVVLLVGLAIVTDWTIRLVVLNAKLSGRDSYTDVSVGIVETQYTTADDHRSCTMCLATSALPRSPSSNLPLPSEGERYRSTFSSTGRG
jgi:hypothetical protein